MSDLAPSGAKEHRLSCAGGGDAYSTSPGSNLDADGDPPIGSPSASSVDIPHEAPGDATLLHLLDGYYIKRHSVDPWNTTGGFCDVFTGDHPVFGKVALKRPRMSGDQCTESQLRNFISEGRIWKELRHPNVLQFVGMIDNPSHVWLVSVFAENGTLLEYIHNCPGADREGLVFQFTSGLAYLHSKDVVHGDLKSANLFISANHKLLIGDFGLSKIKGMATASSKKGVGSVQWMAPELLFAEDVTKTLLSDVYAYGITISEILRGKLPFDQYTNHVALVKAMMENKRPPTVPLESPQGKSYAILWAVAEECWDPEPSKRPSMTDICSRFLLDYTRAIAGASPSGNESADGAHPSAGLAELVTTRLSQSINIDPQFMNSAILSSNTRDTRLVQLLGNAEYGDVGHLKEDGLCLDGTRVEALEKLDAWADDDSSSRVMLLKGQAGRGKSTIARSVSSRFRKRWGNSASSAIFHFRRNNAALNSRPVCALARQLAVAGDPRVQAAVLKSVQDHEDVAELRLEEQFEILLVQSVKALGPDPPRILFVLDALDECSDHPLTSALLRLIRQHAASLPSTVKFLLTSRPEDHIVRPFSASFDEAQEDLDTVEKAVIDRDIGSYFTTRLSEIQRDFGFDDAWVSPEDIDGLVKRTQGLFQWAHAAVEYVRERPRPNLQRLVRSPTLVLGLPALYQQIISTAFPTRKDVADDDNLPALIQHVIGSLVIAHYPMSPTVLEYLWDQNLDGLPFSDPSIVIREDILGRLGSIFVLPDSPDSPIHFMHASVRDFFTNPAQCEDTRFLIDPSAHHARLADICFRRMKKDLKPDICMINDPSKMNSEVLDVVEQRIPSGLRYCCRSWSTHISGAMDIGNIWSNDMQQQLDDFCAERLLHWLEVLSLISALSKVFDMIRQTREWLKNLKAPRSEADALTTSLLGDVDEFCRKFYRVMSANAQHITLSCLLHFSTETALRSIYAPGKQVPRIIRGPAPHRSYRSRVINAGWAISCVAFISDGKTVVAGSDNGQTRLWDVDTGEPKGKNLVSHNGWFVQTITLTPNGKALALGSRDRQAQLWDADTGELQGKPFVGHIGAGPRGPVRSVAFAPDGKTLAVATRLTSAQIQLWDLGTGECKGTPLVGLGNTVLCVAFSPDSKTLASGSDDKNIRLWNVVTGEPIGKPLTGHTSSVRSIAFSPDGKTLASGSDDRQVRVWKVDTGEAIGQPFIGHTGWIKAVAFSWDGRTVASGSSDTEIRLWDVESGEHVGKPLIGHTGFVFSVAFAPDGKTLASGSSDGQIRLWDVDIRRTQRKPLVGHNNLVWSVAVAPDGETLASGSDDEQIRLWDLSTGDLKGQPLGGHNGTVLSAAFAPDGRTLASGSSDNLIRLWDVDTGELKWKPLVGHSGPVKSVAFAREGKLFISTSKMEIIHWIVGNGVPTRTRPLHEPEDLIVYARLGPLVRLSSEASRADEQGWVYINEKPCLWLPEVFYLDGDLFGNFPVQLTLIGRFLVLHHRNIHILDISACL